MLYIKDNSSLWILGNGNNKIQFLSAYDLFKVTERSLKLKGKHIFNIGTDKVLSLREVFKFLIKRTKSQSKIRFFNKPIGILILKTLTFLRLIDFTDYHNKLLISSIVMDINRVKKVLKYKPKKSNAELLLEAYNYYIANKKTVKYGSGQKPRMGFFNVIKYISKFI